MIIKIHIPTKAEARNIRLHVAATQLKLEKTMKSQRKVQVIPLSYPVDPKSCKAAYKDGILQLHIRKQQEEEIFYEIDVKYL